jgi:hypothetical protein
MSDTLLKRSPKERLSEGRIIDQSLIREASERVGVRINAFTNKMAQEIGAEIEKQTNQK